MILPTYMSLADIHAIGGEGQFAPWQPIPPSNAKPLTKARAPKEVVRLTYGSDREHLLDVIRKAYFMPPSKIETWNVPISNLGVIQWNYMPLDWSAEVHPASADQANQDNWRWVEDKIEEWGGRLYYTPDKEHNGAKWVKKSDDTQDADAIVINLDHLDEATFNYRRDELKDANVPYNAVWETGMGAVPLREYTVTGLFTNYSTIVNQDEMGVQRVRQTWADRRLTVGRSADWESLIPVYLANDYFQPMLLLLENLKYTICESNPPAVFLPQAVRVDEQIIQMARAERANFDTLFPGHVWAPDRDPQIPQPVWTHRRFTAEGLQVRIWRIIHETFEFIQRLWRGYEDEERLALVPNNQNPVTKLKGAKLAGVPMPGPLSATITNPYLAMYPSPLGVPYLGGMAGSQTSPTTSAQVTQVAALKVKAEVKPDHLPKFSGEGRNLISWIQQLDMWAEQIDPNQLASILPLIFEGKQAFWWKTRSPQQQLQYRSSWKDMRKAILDHWMTPNWRRDRQKEVENLMFQDKHHPNETVLEYWIRVHTLCVTAFLGMQDAVIIEHFLKGGPNRWDDILPMDVRRDVTKFQLALDEYEDKLTRASRHRENSNKNFKKLSQKVAAMHEVLVAAAATTKPNKGTFKRESRPYVNKGAPKEKMKPFYRGPPIDSVKSNNTPKSKGLAGCWICKSDQHFGKDCPKWKSEMDLQKQAKKTMVAANIPYETAHIIAAMKEDSGASDSEGPPNIDDLEESEKETSSKEDSTESESGEDF
jgi:hypothetical protein